MARQGKRNRGRPPVPLERIQQVLMWRREGKSDYWIAQKLGLRCRINAYGKMRSRTVSRYVKKALEIEARGREASEFLSRLERIR